MWWPVHELQNPVGGLLPWLPGLQAQEVAINARIKDAVAEGSAWNSLEIAKLAISVLTPLLLVFVGFVVSRAARRIEQAQWANRKLIERRLELYDELAPKLNELFSFFALIGDFKGITPETAISLKRNLDRSFFVNRYLFSDRFASLYQDFIGNKCFAPYSGGTGHAAKILASRARQQSERGESWKGEWETLFC